MLTKDIGLRKGALAFWLSGMTFTAIGQRMGVSRQWVHEMLVPPTALRKATYDLAGGKCSECGMHLGRNAHYHSTDNGPIDDFTKPLVVLCCGCHRKAHEGGDV